MTYSCVCVCMLNSSIARAFGVYKPLSIGIAY